MHVGKRQRTTPRTGVGRIGLCSFTAAAAALAVVQRKIVTPNDFTDLTQVGDRLRNVENRYNATAQPSQWKFTTSGLVSRDSVCVTLSCS